MAATTSRTGRTSFVMAYPSGRITRWASTHWNIKDSIKAALGCGNRGGPGLVADFHRRSVFFFCGDGRGDVNGTGGRYSLGVQGQRNPHRRRMAQAITDGGSRDEPETE